MLRLPVVWHDDIKLQKHCTVKVECRWELTIDSPQYDCFSASEATLKDMGNQSTRPSVSTVLTKCSWYWSYRNISFWKKKPSKSEGFDSCDRPSNLTQIGFKSSTFHPMWPWNLMDDLKKIIGHLFYITSSFVHHLKPLSELKLELLPGNAQFGSKLAIFCPVWPWNFMDDLEKQEHVGDV